MKTPKETGLRHFLNFEEKEYTYKEACKKCSEAIDIALKKQAKLIEDNLELTYTREEKEYSEEKQFIITRSKLRDLGILKQKHIKENK